MEMAQIRHAERTITEKEKTVILNSASKKLNGELKHFLIRRYKKGLFAGCCGILAGTLPLIIDGNFTRFLFISSLAFIGINIIIIIYLLISKRNMTKGLKKRIWSI